MTRRAAAVVIALGLALGGGGTVAAARLPEARPIAAPPVGLSAVRVGGEASAARLVLDLDERVEGRPAGGTPRVGEAAFELPHLLSSQPTQGRGRAGLTGWRLERAGYGDRLVLSLAPGARVARSFVAPPAQDGGSWRFVIDVEAGSTALPEAPRSVRRPQAAADPIGDLAASAVSRPAAAPTMAASGDYPASARQADRSPASIALYTEAAGLQAAGAPFPKGAAASGMRVAQTRSATPPAPTGVQPDARDSAALKHLAVYRTPAGRGVKTIVIDAGHGGHDTGAQSMIRNEKDLTLAAALDLRTRLERTGRFRVVMTRDNDAFIPLDERVRIARRAGADLFISLHADSAGSNPIPHGASVYTLSDHGRTRVNTVLNPHDWIAQAGGRQTESAVRQILIDLSQRNTQNQSSQFAKLLITHISDKTELLPRTHRDASLFVLLAPDVPAVLLEMGFITNPGDAMRLTDPESRGKLMNGVADAIDAYFSSTPKLTAG